MPAPARLDSVVKAKLPFKNGHLCPLVPVHALRTFWLLRPWRHWRVVPDRHRREGVGGHGMTPASTPLATLPVSGGGRRDAKHGPLW